MDVKLIVAFVNFVECKKIWYEEKMFVVNEVPYNVDRKCNENGAILSFETKCFGKNYYYYTHAKWVFG